MNVDSLLRAWADDGMTTRGQIYGSIDGVPFCDVAWGCDGIGRPVTSDMRFRIYCAGKPVLAAALCAAHEAGLLELENRLDAYLTGVSDALGARTLLEVLGHRAGLGTMGGFEAALAPPALRREIAYGERPAPGAHPPRYTEFVGWELLAAVLEEVTGTRVDRAIARMLGPDWVTPTFDEPDDVGVNVLWRGERAFPLLAERYLPAPFTGNAAIGAVASMRTLGRFAEQLLDCTDPATVRKRPGARVVGRHMFASDGVGWDRTLERWCRLGGGVMLDVSGHYFGDGWSDRSFGHSGLFGVTWFAADPATRIVVAVHLIDVVHADASVMVRRPRVNGDLLALAAT